MNTADWYEANQRYLMQEISRIRVCLEHALPDSSPPVTPPPLLPVAPPPALDQLCQTFGLSPFERDLLLLCAGVELDGNFAALCARVQGDPQRTFPTFSLALSVLPKPHWTALSPQAPLRRWQLLEIGAGKALTSSPLRIDERILHALTGVYHLDERLMGMIKPIKHTETLVPSHQTLAERLVTAWSTASRLGVLIVQLCGEDGASKRSIAAAACTQLNLNLQRLSTVALPTAATDLTQLLRLWEREAVLTRSALLLECDDLETPDTARDTAIARFIEECAGLLIVASRDRRRPPNRPLITMDVHHPTAPEQRLVWQTVLNGRGSRGTIDQLVTQFNLNATAIHTIGAESLSQKAPPDELLPLLWDNCRGQARPRLDDLAQRIDSSANWDDLVLPEAQKQVLQEIAAHVQQRATVYEAWGFGGKSGRGLGISALFAGASGTGKTMAAEVVARELRLDLYRIDLSQVVSKYIGETEKNLRRVFDAAEAGGVVLLFDEADSLFGKRSEVKDSHDRYANMEVSYLLQRMESYRGLAILTTNLKDAIDQAFLRRLRFIVKFPFPDAAQRAEIWRRVFPPSTPTEGLDYTRLAQLSIAGGNIRSIALNAAFIAASAGEPIRMSHILTAAQGEYTKIERTLTGAEVKGWLSVC